MKIGAHISIAGGIQNAPQRAKYLDCECFQMFSRSPHGGRHEKITPETAELFVEECKKNGFEIGKDYIIHTPYYINLASTNNRIYYGSIKAIREEIDTASLLKAPFVITHIGSSKDLNGENLQIEINKKVLAALEKIYDGYNGSAMLLLEIAAGSGNIIGDTFEEIGYFISETKKIGIDLGFCFDTCHSFAAGYDLNKPENITNIFKQIDEEIGLENLKIIHFNDSQGDFNSKIDRHEHIGQGKIGTPGLEKNFQMAEKLNINVILETKHDKIQEDLGLLKSWRNPKEY